MDRIQRQCNPVQGANWGQVPTLELQLGPRYRYLLLEIIVTAAAAKTPTLPDVLGDIIIKIGGNPQRTHSAIQFDAINKSYGAQYGCNAYNYDGGALTWVGGVPHGPAAGGRTADRVLPAYLFPRAVAFELRRKGNDGLVHRVAGRLRAPELHARPEVSRQLSANILANSAITINAYSETDTWLARSTRTNSPWRRSRNGSASNWSMAAQATWSSPV